MQGSRMAMDRLCGILSCFPSKAEAKLEIMAPSSSNQADPSEKDILIAQDIIDTLISTKQRQSTLKCTFEDQFGTLSWTSNLARLMLNRLIHELQLKDPKLFGNTLKNAYQKAQAAFDESFKEIATFVREHPDIFYTILALGVLWLLLPWILEALGFAESGIITDTLAAWWQSRYAGYVPKGSLFTFLQRLGMTWKP